MDASFLLVGTRPRERSLSHRGVIREARHHYRVNHQVAWNKPIVDVHVEVVGSCSVVDPVLDELEPG